MAKINRDGSKTLRISGHQKGANFKATVAKQKAEGWILENEEPQGDFTKLTFVPAKVPKNANVTQQSVVICGGSDSGFRANISVVTFEDERETHYKGDLNREQFEVFCGYAGVTSDRLAADRDGRTSYDHKFPISNEMLIKLGFRLESKPEGRSNL